MQKKIKSFGCSSRCNFFLKCTWSNTCIFWGEMKKPSFPKNYKYGIKAPIKSHTCIYFWYQNFFISKKITSVGSSAFQKKLQRLDQLTLVIFFAFLKKITTTGRRQQKSFSKSKWTGLLLILMSWVQIPSKENNFLAIFQQFPTVFCII